MADITVCVAGAGALNETKLYLLNSQAYLQHEEIEDKI